MVENHDVYLSGSFHRRVGSPHFLIQHVWCGLSVRLCMDPHLEWLSAVSMTFGVSLIRKGSTSHCIVAVPDGGDAHFQPNEGDAYFAIIENVRYFFSHYGHVDEKMRHISLHEGLREWRKESCGP